MNSLQGNSLNVIKHLGIVDSNYNETIRLLKKRYESQSKVIYKLIDKLLDYPVIQKNKPHKLIELIDFTRQLITQLKSYGHLYAENRSIHTG